MIEPSEDDIGRLVRYIPGHARGDASHPDCEDGVVTSFNSQYVFVRYVKDMTPRATLRRDLIWQFA